MRGASEAGMEQQRSAFRSPVSTDPAQGKPTQPSGLQLAALASSVNKITNFTTAGITRPTVSSLGYATSPLPGRPALNLAEPAVALTQAAPATSTVLVSTTACQPQPAAYVSTDSILQSDTGVRQSFTPLHLAAQAGDLAAVCTLLEKATGDLNARTTSLATPLHLAADAGHLAVVQKLLQFEEVQQNALDAEGRTPLLAAVHQGCLEVADCLGRKPQALQFSIHFFAQHGYLEALREQLERGAPADLPDENDMTPLHRACLHGHFEVAEELVEKRKVDILLATGGKTAILLAAEGGNERLVGLLLQAASKLPPHHVSKAGFGVNLLQHKTKSSSADPGLTPLLVAAKYGHTLFVRALIAAGANLQAADRNGHTALHHACLGGGVRHLDVVRELLLHVHRDGTVIDAMDRTACTPLILAANHYGDCPNMKSCAHQEMVQALKAAGADGHFELHHAAFNDQLERVKQLLACSCEACKAQPATLLTTPVCHRCLSQQTALHLAAHQGHLAVVQELLKAGAECNSLDHCFTSPLICACDQGHASVVHELLQRGAHVYQKTRWEGETCLHRVAKVTPEQLAEAEHVKCMQLLLGAVLLLKQKPVDVCTEKRSNKPGRARRLGGSTMGATMTAGQVVQERMTDVTVVNAKTYGVDETALCVAARQGHVDIVRLLLDMGRADATASDCNRVLPLHHAAEQGHLAICKELAKAGSPLMAPNYEGCTPLHVAAAGGHVDVVKYLISSRGRTQEESLTSLLNTRDDFSMTTMHHAAGEGQAAVVKLLLDLGADPLARNDASSTPLHMAALEGHLEVVKVLMAHFQERATFLASTPTDEEQDAGAIPILLKAEADAANPLSQDAMGWSPLMCACACQTCNADEETVLAIVKLLIEFLPTNESTDASPSGMPRVELIIQYNKNHENSLLTAVRSQRQRVVEYLIEHGGRVVDREGTFPVLHEAIRGKNFAIFEAILAKGRKAFAEHKISLDKFVHLISGRDWLGDSPLHVAAATNNVKAAGRMLDEEKEIGRSNQPNAEGWFAIHSAARHGNLDIIRLLSQVYGENLQRFTTHGRTPLHIAAAFGQLEVVAWLLNQQCDMDLLSKPPPGRKDLSGKKSKWAYNDERLTVTKEDTIQPTQPSETSHAQICPAGACTLLPYSLGISYFEVTIHEMVEEKDGRLPVPDMSIGVGHEKVPIISIPPGLYSAFTFGYCSRDGYVYRGNVSTGRPYGPLYGLGDVIGVLFNRANRTISFTKNGVHLGLAVRHTEFPLDLNHEDMAAMLGWDNPGIKSLVVNFGTDAAQPFEANEDDLLCTEEAGYNPAGEKEPWRHKERLHPLHLAVCSQSLPVLRTLLGQGANVYQQDANGWTTLHFACHEGWTEGLKVLLDQHRNIVLSEQQLKTSAEQDDTDATELRTQKAVAEMAAFVDKRTKYGNGSSALLFAIKRGHFKTATLLIQDGRADCRVVDEKGRTLLMHAAMVAAKVQDQETQDMMELLIQRGVVVKQKDDLDRTALQYASQPATVRYLESKSSATVPYPGHEHLLIRADMPICKGAVGQVIFAKLRVEGKQDGSPVAIKFHHRDHRESWDRSFRVLQNFDKMGDARQYIACLPAGLADELARFEDPERYPDHPYALVIEGGDQTLQDVLDNIGPAGAPGVHLPESQARFIFDCLVNAVNFVHMSNLVHHDLKSKNFVRFFDGRYKLIDFDNSRESVSELMGNTTAEICPPEAAEELLRTRNSSSPGAIKLHSNKAMDMWALGCVLYQMVTHRWLLCDLAGWPQEEIWDSKHSKYDACEVWKHVQDSDITRLLNEHVPCGEDNAAHALLTHLLHRQPSLRWKVADVLGSSYLQGGHSMHVIAKQVQDLNHTMTDMSGKIDIILDGVMDIQQRMIKLDELPMQIKAGFQDVSSRIASVRSVVLQVKKAGKCPSTFVIGPELSAREMLAMQQQPGVGHPAITGWLDALHDAYVHSERKSLSEIAERLTHKRHRLKLVCESCGLPQGEGYILKSPQEWVTSFLPAMQMSLRVARLVNGALGAASIVFPGLPSIPAGAVDAAGGLLDTLSQKSSASDYECVQDALEHGGDGFQQQVDAGLRQLKEFLDQADRSHTWGNLILVDMDGVGKANKSLHIQDPKEPRIGTSFTLGKDSTGIPQSVLWVCQACASSMGCSQSGVVEVQVERVPARANFSAGGRTPARTLPGTTALPASPASMQPLIMPTSSGATPRKGSMLACFRSAVHPNDAS